MRLYYDNKSASSIAYNPVQRDQTKHVEVNRHFIKEKLDSELICTPFVTSSDQLANILTKGLPGAVCQRLLNKIGRHDIHSQS